MTEKFTIRKKISIKKLPASNENGLTSFSFRECGFTLVETLVVISLLSIVGVMILTIFSRTLKGSNKSQIVAMIKENGQSVLENMDKTIRNSDSVFCTTSDTTVVNTGSTYTRFKFFPPTSNSNGYIQQEVFNSVVTPTPPNFCLDYPRNGSAVNLTDNSTTGVSVSTVNPTPVFAKATNPGFPDQVTIKFQIQPGISTPTSITGQIDPIVFQTTIELRNTIDNGQ